MSTEIDAPADDITLPAHRCIKPNCPVSCSDCNHAIPGSDAARLLVVRLLDEFGNDDRDGPYEEGEHPLIDEARAFLSSSPADRVGGWISVAERLPEVGIDVLVYEPSRPDDWPGTLRVSIDHISEDYEGWYSHGEAYEHYLAVAGPDVTCTGLSEKASYTHWMPLPPAPGHAAVPAAVDVGAAQAETAQAAPVVLPLTAAQVGELVDQVGYSTAEDRANFINGIRWGERAHGIATPGATHGNN